MSASFGPILSAGIAATNAIALVAILAGYAAIRRGDRAAHRRAMLTAFGTSCVFLVIYLTRVGLFPHETYVGVLRPLYLVILGTHTVLAAVTPFLVARALYLALQQRFAEHKRVVRFAMPVWLYVSTTGVVVYLLRNFTGGGSAAS